MNDVERHAVFFIADISGYTKFIFSNEKDISHSQMVIRELITTLLEEVNLPFRLVRIEGDAIFLYATKDDDGQYQMLNLSETTNVSIRQYAGHRVDQYLFDLSVERGGTPVRLKQPPAA